MTGGKRAQLFETQFLDAKSTTSYCQSNPRMLAGALPDRYKPSQVQKEATEPGKAQPGAQPKVPNHTGSTTRSTRQHCNREGAAGEGWGAPLQTVLGGRTLQCSVGVTLLPLQESAVGVQDAQV